ncbi:MAG: hypothetical protein FJ284_13145 [Planctomycetes bacterium]|nr:hypothetical protein [Planctomycetota bacterium]
MIVRPGRPTARLAIEPVGAERGPPPTAAGGPLTGTVIPSTTPLVLVHGDLPALPDALRLVAGDRTLPEIVRLDAAPVPPHLVPRDLDAFDAAVICGRSVPDLSPETIAALDGWTRCGGRLVFIAGESAAAVAADGGIAADWLPGRDPSLVSLTRYGGLEAYARARGLAGRAGRGGLVPRFRGPVAGAVETSEGAAGTLPLVVRRGHGFGTITWLGLDVDAPWCRSWPGCEQLLAALLGGRREAAGGLAAPEVGRPAVPDLAGQLRVALDRFPATDAVARSGGVPFEVIAILGVLYVVALFPLDWWLVSSLRRPAIAWVSLPLWACGFTAAAWALGGLWGRDAPPRCHAAEVIDIDAAGGLVRAATWIAARSPTNALLDLAAAVALPTADHSVDVAVSWFADAGKGFGGVDAAASHPSLAAADYTYGASLADLTGVPIAAGASRLFEAEWTAATPPAVVESTLASDGRGLLAGSLVHRLPFPLTRCRLLHAGWLYDIGDLAAGQPFEPAAGRGPRSLAAELTRRLTEGDHDWAERWNPTAVDVPRILEMACFHAAAGGPGYTGLEAGRLTRLDLSPVLGVDRAVLVGHAPPDFRGTAWTVRLRHGDGATLDLPPAAADAGSLVRIVLPLATSPATAPEETKP